MPYDKKRVIQTIGLGVFCMLPAFGIPYLMILAERGHFISVFDLTLKHWFVILPTLIFAGEMTVGFLRHGNADFYQRLDRSAISIAKTVLIYAATMALIGVADFFSLMSSAAVEWWSYALLYGFLSRLFYFAFVMLPFLLVAESKRH